MPRVARGGASIAVRLKALDRSHCDLLAGKIMKVGMEPKRVEWLNRNLSRSGNIHVASGDTVSLSVVGERRC